MPGRNLPKAILLAGALSAAASSSWAWDDSKYPNFSGQWRSIGGPGRFARDQKAPLTPEYQAYFDSIKEEGGQGNSNMTYLCYSPGLPRVTAVVNAHHAAVPRGPRALCWCATMTQCPSLSRRQHVAYTPARAGPVSRAARAQAT